MNSIPWKYAIDQAFQMANIEIMPGIYRNCVSYTYLWILSIQPLDHLISASDVSRHHLPSSMIFNLSKPYFGFIIPLTSFNQSPVISLKIKNAFDWYCSMMPKNSLTDITTFRDMQQVAK